MVAKKTPSFSTRTALDRTENALASATPALDLTISNPTRAGVTYPQELFAALASAESLVYAPDPRGPRRAREVVAAHLGARGVTISPDHVVLTASTSEAYSFLFKLLCDAGDEVLAPTPSYPLFDHLARFDHVKLRPYRLAYDGQWSIDRASLEPSDRTRAVLAVSPNNPTGSVTDDADLRCLEALGLPLVVDEVFLDYPLEGSAPSATRSRAPLVFTMSGLSKSFALPQLKLAWIAVTGEDALVGEALARLDLVADAYLSVSAPVLAALPTILTAGGVVQRQLHARVRANLATLRRRVEGTAITVPRVAGGWYALLEMPRVQSDEDWALALAERDVATMPGYFFDIERDATLVVSLITPEDTFAEGVSRILAAL